MKSTRFYTCTTSTGGLCVLLIMDINAFAWMVTAGSSACMMSAKLKYLKICVIDALKDKRWCSGLQREDNTRLNWGEQQVGGDHYHCRHTHTYRNTLAHTQLHAWLDYRCSHADMQQSDGRTQTHHRVFDRVNQTDDVGSPAQVFKNFDFPFDLLLLDGLWFEIKDTHSI